MPSALEVTGAIRFFDSGTYETEGLADTPGFHEPPGKQPWSEELYIERAKNTVCAGDVLVSYDDRSLSLVDQVKQSLVLFERTELQGIKRDLLLHPNGAPPDALAEVIIDLAPDIDIIGLTEKDIGFPWFIAASYIRQLRTKLDSTLERYIPIHIFGCFDPQTISHLFFSGADIFDGLAWMRYYFHNGHAFYDKEFEYKAPPEQLLKPIEATQNLLRHNVEELERLHADLRYAVLTRDLSQFEECLGNLQVFESATLL
jgi:predicted RNA-binding protein